MDHFAYLTVLCLPLYGSLCLPYCTLPTSIWITWLTSLYFAYLWITLLTLLYFAYLCMDHLAYLTVLCLPMNHFAYLTVLCLPMDHFAYLTVLCLPLYGSLCLLYCTLPTSIWITLLTLLYSASLCMDHFAYLTVLCLSLYGSLCYLTVLCLPLCGSPCLPYSTLPTSVWITLLTLLQLPTVPSYVAKVKPASRDICSCILCLPTWLKLKQLSKTSAAAYFAFLHG